MILSASSLAQQLYYTSEPGMTLDKIDMSTGAIAQLFSTANLGKPDSLILTAGGKIIYDMSSAGVIDEFDPVSRTNINLVSGLSGPRDFVFDPGSTTSLLVALYSPGAIIRLNLTTKTWHYLIRNLGTCDGLAYDANGNLFAVANHNTVVQVDPVAGIILKTLVLEPHYRVNGGDGMVYDTFTGKLWISHDGTDNANGLIEVPTDLSTFTLFQSGNIHVPDGLISDGQGNLYIGAGLQKIVVYNIPTNTITKALKAYGVDDVAFVP
jgi:hypothetical protein